MVCLGGSAGSLEAYMDILGSLPADTGMGFVIAPHRALEYAHLLAVPQQGDGNACCGSQARHATRTLFDLRTTSRPPGWPKTINTFLCSLAEAAGPRAGAVILSGLDGDSSAALKAIKSGSGLTFAQPDASYDSMRRTAVETGHIDYLLPASGIAKALLASAHQSLQTVDSHSG